MNVNALAILYGLIALGCVIAAALRPERRLVDLVLLVLLWPLYAPFYFARAPALAPSPARATASERELEQDLLAALRRASGTPLADILPDAETGGALAARLRSARAKLEEIDALLARPDFSAASATARQEQLERDGDERAAAIAAGRVQSIRHLVELRDRFRRDLDQVRELVAQLRIQAEVVRLAQSCDDGTRGLVAELCARVEGLDELLATLAAPGR